MKKFNIKAFFVDHGEKLGFGVGLLLLLGVLGTSDWFPYDKDPSEIITKADKAKQTIDSNTWPEDVRKGFTIRDYGQNIRELRGPLATIGYDYSTPLWQPLYRPQQLANDPKFLAVMELEAKAGMFVLGVSPKVEKDPNAPETTTESKTTVAATDDDEFAPAAKTSAPNPFGGAGAGAAFGHAGGASSSGAAIIDPAQMMGAHASGMPPGMSSGVMGEGMIGEFGSGLAPGVTGRGERFISVRGIWPVLQQMQLYRSSMNLQSVNDARALLEIMDFVLERKTATAGADPWAGEWQTVDISRAKEILAEASDFDIDTFDPNLVDTTITMPLPKRLLGRWGDYATHPQIKDFQLKGPALERELKLQERLMSEYNKMASRLPQKPKPRGGFSGTQANIRGMADAMYSSPEGMSSFNSGMKNFMESDPSMMGMSMAGGSGTGGKLTPPDLKSRLTAVGRLFLFRYFDFDVRPGYAYRYRVKLVLRNPNYQRPLDQVIDKSVAEGETRESEWSTESTVAVVPETTSYFLKTVNRDPVHEATRSAQKAVAYLKMFQWDQTVGTMIADTIQVMSVGQFLGEKDKTSWHLDVAKPSFKEEKVTFQTDDVYLDGVGDSRLVLDDHKDLKLPSDKKGLLGLASTAVVMNDVGQLKSISTGLDADKESLIQERVDRERKAFDNIKGKDAQAANPLDGGAYPGGMMESSGAEMYGAPGGKKKGGKAKPNPRKAGAMFSGGSMMGMP